jgi:hypothetical protein
MGKYVERLGTALADPAQLGAGPGVGTFLRGSQVYLPAGDPPATRPTKGSFLIDRVPGNVKIPRSGFNKANYSNFSGFHEDGVAGPFTFEGVPTAWGGSIIAWGMVDGSDNDGPARDYVGTDTGPQNFVRSISGIDISQRRWASPGYWLLKFKLSPVMLSFANRFFNFSLAVGGSAGASVPAGQGFGWRYNPATDAEWLFYSRDSAGILTTAPTGLVPAVDDLVVFECGYTSGLDLWYRVNGGLTLIKVTNLPDLAVNLTDWQYIYAFNTIGVPGFGATTVKMYTSTIWW